MRSRSASTFTTTAKLAALFTASVVALAACGGGSDTAAPAPAPAPAVSDTQASSSAANATYVPSESTTTMSEAMATTEAAVAATAGATGTVTHPCLGSGSIIYTVTGPGTLAELHNGKLDAGEVYTVTFNGCRGAGSVASLTGQWTMTVISATSTVVSVSTTTTGLTATSPRGTTQVNGSSTLTRTITASGANTTTARRVQTPRVEVKTNYNGRMSSLALTAVDLTRAVTVDANGNLVSSSSVGTATISGTLPVLGNFSFTVSNPGSGVTYDANGVPVSGQTTIVAGSVTFALTFDKTQLTIAVDSNSDGVIDWSFTVAINSLASNAG